MRWTWTHYPYMMIYISSASKCWKRFCLVSSFSSEKLPNIECFLPFFCFVLVLVLSFGARGMQFLVLFYSCSGSSVTLSHLVEIWKGINHKTKGCERSKTTIVGKGKSEKREQSVEWWNEWGWLSICHIWKQACNITYYYGITMDIMPTF